MTALLVPVPVRAVAPIDRDIATPVTTVTHSDLENLPNDRDLRTILELHNKLRDEVGVPPLRWNPEAAERASAWARTMAETGRLEHSPRAGREFERENIVISRRSANSLVAMMQTWSDEKQYFRPGLFPDVCAGDWTQCGHYTQMIWPTTTEVGCGFHYGRDYDALVCRYSPPGNRDGNPVGLQPPVIAQAPEPVDCDLAGETALAGRDRLLNRGTPPRFDLGLYGGWEWTSPWFESDGGFGIGSNPIFGLTSNFRTTSTFGVRIHEPYLPVNDAIARPPPKFDLGLYGGWEWKSPWFESDGGFGIGSNPVFGLTSTFWTASTFGVRVHEPYCP